MSSLPVTIWFLISRALLRHAASKRHRVKSSFIYNAVAGVIGAVQCAAVALRRRNKTVKCRDASCCILNAQIRTPK